jgi:hypothetical protein
VARAARDGRARDAGRDRRPVAEVLDLPEFVAIIDVEIDVSVRALNRTTQPRDERYRQTVEISVVQTEPMDDSASAEARAFRIYSVARDAPPRRTTRCPATTTARGRSTT